MRYPTIRRKEELGLPNSAIYSDTKGYHKTTLPYKYNILKTSSPHGCWHERFGAM
jgi:hypothetical protein